MVEGGGGGCELEPVTENIISLAEMKSEKHRSVPWASSCPPSPSPSPVRLEVASGWPPCDETWSAAWALRNCWKA